MVTNIIKNVAANICKSNGEVNGLIYSLSRITPQEYFWGILIIIFVIIILIALFKHGTPVIIETWFGKLKIPSMRKKGNVINMCELCKINIVSLIANILDLYHKINKLEQKNINEQIRVLDGQFFLENSWINNCHGEIIRKKILLTPNLSESEKTKIIMKNEQILYFIWLIKRQEIYEFVKNIILLNNFCDKNPVELRYFSQEKSEVLSAKISGGTNLYPDWDDKELLFKRQEYSDILMEKIGPRIEETILHILEKCQVIQHKFNTEIQMIKEEKDVTIKNFIKSLPPTKKEKN